MKRTIVADLPVKSDRIKCIVSEGVMVFHYSNTGFKVRNCTVILNHAVY